MKGAIVFGLLIIMLVGCSEQPGPTPEPKPQVERTLEPKAHVEWTPETEAEFLERYKANLEGAKAIVSGCRIKPDDEIELCRYYLGGWIKLISREVWHEQLGDDALFELGGRCAVMAKESYEGPFAKLFSECMTDGILVLEQCDDSTEITGKAYGVKKGIYPLRKGPSNSYDKIMYWKAARAMVNGKAYMNIDDTTTVFEECTNNSWSWVRIVDPGYMSDHYGWIESNKLREGHPTSFLDSLGKISAPKSSGAAQKTSSDVHRGSSASEHNAEWAEIQEHMDAYNEQVEQETRDMLNLMDEL